MTRGTVARTQAARMITEGAHLGTIKALRGLLDRLEKWSPEMQDSSTFRKPVRIKALEDMKSLGELLGKEAKSIEYMVDGKGETLESIAAMSPARLTNIVITTYPTEGGSNDDIQGYIARFQIHAHVAKGKNEPGSFMDLHIRPPAQSTTNTLTMAKAQDFAERCTEVVASGERKKPYAVVNLINTATHAQLARDKKIRRQSALISLATSATVTVLAWGLAWVLKVVVR